MKYLCIVSLIIFNLLFSCDNSYKTSFFLEKTIFIDPGHGGLDNGCDFENIYEDDINLKIASYLFEKCISNNLVAYISRTDDYDLSSLYAENHKNEDLKKRTKYIEQSQCDIFISIHLNYYKDSSVSGPMVYYKKNNYESHKLAQILQNNLNKVSQKNKISHSDDFYIFKHTSMPGVLVECGFLSNYEERNKLITSQYQKSLALSMYTSIKEYFSL